MVWRSRTSSRWVNFLASPTSLWGSLSCHLSHSLLRKTLFSDSEGKFNQDTNEKSLCNDNVRSLGYQLPNIPKATAHLREACRAGSDICVSNQEVESCQLPEWFPSKTHSWNSKSPHTRIALQCWRRENQRRVQCKYSHHERKDIRNGTIACNYSWTTEFFINSFYDAQIL